MEKNKFKEFVSAKKLKSTKERNEILNEILSIEGHFDRDELFKRLKAKGSKISRASVYRTIPLFLESSIIIEVERVDRHVHYEKVIENSHHDHMICIRCGKVIEFYSPTLEMLQDELCQRENFSGMRHSLEILGYCERCSE